MEIRKKLTVENVASNLIRVREHMGISREQAADIINVSTKDIAAYETAQEPVAATDLFLLAAGLGISVETFFTEAN